MKLDIDDLKKFECLVGRIIIGFSHRIIYEVDNNNRPLNYFKPELMQFEYCNPGKLLLYYLNKEDECACLEIGALNFLDSEERQYSRFIINNYINKSDFYNSYLLNREVSKIEIYSMSINDNENDRLILIAFKDNLEILIENTNSINGSIVLYFNKNQIRNILSNMANINSIYNYSKRISFSV